MFAQKCNAGCNGEFTRWSYPSLLWAQRLVYGQIVRERKIKRSTHAHVSTCSVSPVESRLQVPARRHSCWNSSPMILASLSGKFTSNHHKCIKVYCALQIHFSCVSSIKTSRSGQATRAFPLLLLPSKRSCAIPSPSLLCTFSNQ